MIKDRSRLLRFGAVVNLVALAIASMCQPSLAQSFDYGVAPVGYPVLPLLFSQTLENCQTQISKIQSSDPEFVIKSVPGLPSCYSYSWNNNPGTCYLEFVFTPNDIGQRSASISFTQDPQTPKGCLLEPENLYGAGFTLTPSLPLGPNHFGLALPSPQPTSSPFWQGYSALTFDSGNAKVSWTPTLSYHTNGGIPMPAAVPNPAPSPFTTLNDSITLGFGAPIPSVSPTPTASFPVAGGKLTVSGVYSANTFPPVPVDPVTNEYTYLMTGIKGASVTFPSPTSLTHCIPVTSTAMRFLFARVPNLL
jgi:hypothetical protein